MSGERVLLDSVILIDHFNGMHVATDYIRSVIAQSCISAITRAEVLAGFDEPAFSKAKALLERIPLVPIDAEVADLGARMRRTYHWKLPDALQAAIATHYGLALATRNTRDFPKRKHTFVRVPYTL